jgi:hypothetical protein
LRGVDLASARMADRVISARDGMIGTFAVPGL